MRIATIFIAAIASTATVGCAFSPVDRVAAGRYSEPEKINEFFGLTKESAMDIARSALQSSGYEVISFVTELGEVKTKTKEVLTPAICDCGSWNGTVISGSAISQFSILAKQLPDGKTSVKTSFSCSTTFVGTNLYGAATKVETYPCASRGAPENMFWEKFREIDMVRKQKPS